MQLAQWWCKLEAAQDAGSVQKRRQLCRPLQDSPYWTRTGPVLTPTQPLLDPYRTLTRPLLHPQGLLLNP